MVNVTNKMRMVHDALDGIVNTQDIQSVHGTDQATDEMPKYIHVDVCHDAATDEEWRNCQETLKKVKTALDEAGLLTYDVHKGIIHLSNEPGEPTTIQVSVSSGDNFSPLITRVEFGISDELARKIAEMLMENEPAAYHARTQYPNGDIERIPFIKF